MRSGTAEEGASVCSSGFITRVRYMLRGRRQETADCRCQQARGYGVKVFPEYRLQDRAGLCHNCVKLLSFEQMMSSPEDSFPDRCQAADACSITGKAREPIPKCIVNPGISTLLKVGVDMCVAHFSHQFHRHMSIQTFPARTNNALDLR